MNFGNREEYIEKVTVVERKPHNAEITLNEYDPEWPALFEREARKIRKALGQKARRIEHVGSTSVPCLCAKPVIDILLVVDNSADEPSYTPDLEAMGYSLRIREPDWFEHRMFKGLDIDSNLHVFSEGASEIGQMLLFRDWLRTDENDRQLYAETKRKLARRTWKHIQDYADAKSEVVLAILERAAADLL